MKKIRKKYGKIVCVLSLIVLLTSGCGQEEEAVFLEQKQDLQEEKEESGEENPEEVGSEETTSEEATKEKNPEAKICIFVCGAVKNPGVYYLNANARVYEAIEAAGGFSEEADTGWLNQAEILTDGDKIRIYSKEETQKMQEEGTREETKEETNSEGSKEESGKVNLNTASLEELQTVPGIGAAKAAAIIEYRETQGKFNSTQDIQNVPGIKGKTFEKIQPYITAG